MLVSMSFYSARDLFACVSFFSTAFVSNSIFLLVVAAMINLTHVFQICFEKHVFVLDLQTANQLKLPTYI